MSITHDASASGRYWWTKLLQLRLNRRRTSRSGTSCPPLRTRAAMRLSATRTSGNWSYKTYRTYVAPARSCEGGAPGTAGIPAGVMAYGRLPAILATEPP